MFLTCWLHTYMHAYIHIHIHGHIHKYIYIYTEGREWGVGSIVVESAFLWRPNFQSKGPKTLVLKGFGAIWGEYLGRPKRRSNDHGSNAPFSAL